MADWTRDDRRVLPVAGRGIDDRHNATDCGGAQRSEIEPAHIDVDQEAGVPLTWADGDIARLGLVELRVNCPCAVCHEWRGVGRPIAS